MLHFTRGDGQLDLQGHLDKIKTLSTKIEQKIGQKDNDANDSFVESLSVEELKDVRQVMHAAEYLLTKYQDKKDIKAFLQEYVELILNASNSVNGMKSELEDLVISAEIALKQIQTLHDEVSESLAFDRGVQTKMEDFKIPSLETMILAKTEANTISVKTDEITHKKTETEVGAINLTNSSRRVNTGDYLERTIVEI